MRPGVLAEQGMWSCLDRSRPGGREVGTGTEKSTKGAWLYMLLKWVSPQSGQVSRWQARLCVRPSFHPEAGHSLGFNSSNHIVNISLKTFVKNHKVVNLKLVNLKYAN